MVTVVGGDTVRAIDQGGVPAGIDYPESDGSLISENDWHWEELVDLVYRLKTRYAGDPRYEYLTPPLQGFHLVRGSYRALLPDADGCLVSATLGLRLSAETNHLELYDLVGGDRLERPGELAVTARQAFEAEARARAAAEAESRARAEAEAENRARVAAEAEVERLRTEIDRLRAKSA